MQLSVVGISHHTAPVELRERFALSGELAGQFLYTVHTEGVFEEALVLDTCNRTEVYLVSSRKYSPLDYVLQRIGKLKNIPLPEDASCFYCHEGLATVTHLFRVAASLDSQIVGEHQVLGQVKDAYRLALEKRTARVLLNKLMHWSFGVGKRVQTETELGRGSASIPQAAVELACRTFASLTDKTVLLVGAGETGRLAARGILRAGAGRIILANRTLSRAQEVAGELLEQMGKPSRKEGFGEGEPETEQPITCPALLQLQPQLRDPAGSSASAARPPEYTVQAIAIDDIPSVIAGADLVISSTGAPEPVLTLESVGDALRHSNRPLFVVDIAVPRDVDPRLGDLPNVFLHNIDHLDHLVSMNLERRRQEVPRAQAIVDYEVQQFGKWLNSLQVIPTIKLLQKHVEGLYAAELERYGHRFKADREQLDQMVRSLCSKILHNPVTFLRNLPEQATTSESLLTIDLIRRMFDLDSTEQDE